jgi:hypothetical protein
MSDLIYDWKAWSKSERAMVFAFAIGLALVAAAWMIV